MLTLHINLENLWYCYEEERMSTHFSNLFHSQALFGNRSPRNGGVLEAHCTT